MSWKKKIFFLPSSINNSFLGNVLYLRIAYVTWNTLFTTLSFKTKKPNNLQLLIINCTTKKLSFFFFCFLRIYRNTNISSHFNKHILFIKHQLTAGEILYYSIQQVTVWVQEKDFFFLNKINEKTLNSLRHFCRLRSYPSMLAASKPDFTNI